MALDSNSSQPQRHADMLPGKASRCTLRSVVTYKRGLPKPAVLAVSAPPAEEAIGDPERVEPGLDDTGRQP